MSSAGNDARLKSQPLIGSLTGLRFILALHVVAYHLTDPYLVGVSGALGALLNRGYLAVSAFFVLSGFILTYSYLGPSVASFNRRAFWVARFARIYPVYLLSLALAAPLFLSNTRTEPLKIAAALATVPTMLQAWSPSTAELWNGPAWSLSAEVFFYLLFPFIAIRLIRLRTRALLVWLLACWAFDVVLLTGLDGLALSEHASFNPLVRLPEFIGGVVLGSLYVRRGETTRLGAWPARLVAGVPAVLGAAAVAGAEVLSGGFQLRAAGPGFFAPLFAALIYALARGQGGLSWLLSRPILVLLGEASYAMYLLHVPLRAWMDFLARALPASEPWVHAPWFLAVYLLVLVSASLLAVRFVERPARLALRRAFGAHDRGETVSLLGSQRWSWWKAGAG